MKIFQPKIIPIPIQEISIPQEKKKSIHEILTDVESLLKLSDAELKNLLTPYFSETRKALLPEEKPSKIGLHSRVMKDFLSDPKIAAQVEALRKERDKK